MKRPGRIKDRKLRSRTLAAVNRRIAKLCDELDALQRRQSRLARDSHAAHQDRLTP